jgi:hypothetical protein
VIYNDPYYYPATRYRGTRVVYVQPRRGVAHFGFKERATGEAGTPQVVVRNTPAVTRPGVEGNGNRRAVPRTGAPSVFNPGSTGGNPPAVIGQPRPGVEGGANRRTGATSAGAAASARRPSGAQPGTTRSPATAPATLRTEPRGARGSRTTQGAVLERQTGGAGSSATPPKPIRPTRTPVTRPSVKVRNPGSGGTSTRSPATVRSGGTTSRGAPTVRSGGASSRGTPTVRSGGSASRGTPTVRSGGSASRGTPTVRSRGSSSKPPPRASKPPPRPKPKRPPGGGGGQSLLKGYFSQEIS